MCKLIEKLQNFVAQWQNVDGERANCQKFWVTFIRDVFGIDKPENFIQFEVPVKLEHKNSSTLTFPTQKLSSSKKISAST